MTNVTIDGDADENVIFAACSSAVSAAVESVKQTHDCRLVFACLSAEVAHLGAVLIEAKVYAPEYVHRLLAEVQYTAITLKIKAPKVIYTDGIKDLGTKQ